MAWQAQNGCDTLDAMNRWLSVFVAGASFSAALAQDLPTEELPKPGDVLPEEGEPLEIEPPLLITTRGPDGSLPDARGTTPANVDIAKLEKNLARATKNAGSAERMFKAGIISKVEMEERGLRVIRLRVSLEAVRLEEVRRAVQEQKDRGSAAVSEADLQASEQALAQAEQAAARAAEERHRAELDAALRNLQRQQKLLALGSGRKADLNRAQERLAELQRTGN